MGSNAGLPIVIAAFIILPAALYARWHPRAATIAIIAGTLIALSETP